MKLKEFEALAPRCIVCNSPMKRTINQATNKKKKKPIGILFGDRTVKYYNINMQCARNEKCFGYMSNAVSTYDPIEVKKFYMGYKDIHILACVDEYTEVFANGHTMRIAYVPFESWLRAKGQIYEKMQKILILAGK